MRPSLKALVRTTTFRLALVQAGVMLTFVVALLSYVYVATVGQLIRDSENDADQEFAVLDRAYAEGGMRRLNQEVVERAARQGPMLYVLAEADGTVITGDFQHLPKTPAGAAAEPANFSFERRDDTDGPAHGVAHGRVGRLLGGPILLVARDLGDNAVFAGRITQVLWTAGLLGVVLSVAGGLIASGQAARRAEALSNTARDVMAGDLSRRAPTRGGDDEFDALAHDINAMLDRLERLVHTTRTAGDAIAHDLRSPLTRFRHRLDAALEAAPDSEADREALRKAALEADRLLDMFAAMLKLARVESANTWRFERIDVTAMVTELAEFYGPAAEEQGLVFAAKIEPGLAVRGDTGLVTQAVSNLVENALKYSLPNGRVEMHAMRRPGGRVEICVMDDGPGVPAAERERVTARFVRLESARSTPGVGLGLSLVQAVCKLHRGALVLRDGLKSGERLGLSAVLDLPSVEQPR
jgi:signal transduction histidine kinase